MGRKISTIVKYDGPALNGKSMDVAHLAPSLIALSTVVKSANRLVNGESREIRVMVNADLEQNCFELLVHAAVDNWPAIKDFVSGTDQEALHQLSTVLGWTSTQEGAPIGFFELVKRLKGQTIRSIERIRVNGKNHTKINIDGDNNTVIIANESAAQMYHNQDIRSQASKVLSPLSEDGYESVSFHNGEETFVDFDKDSAPLRESDLPEIVQADEHCANIRASVRVKKPAYEGNSKWTVVYKRAIEVKFSDNDWLEEFQSGQIDLRPGSSLKVQMEERFPVNEDGECIGETSYSIVKVHEVIPPQSKKSKWDLPDF